MCTDRQTDRETDRRTMNSAQTIRESVLGTDSLVDGRRVAERVGLVHWIGRQRLQWIQLVVVIHLVRYTCSSTDINVFSPLIMIYQGGHWPLATVFFGWGIIQGLFKNFKVFFQTYSSNVLPHDTRKFNVSGMILKPLRDRNSITK